MRNWVVGAAAVLAIQAIPARADTDPWSGAPLPPDKARPIPSPITDHFSVRGTFFDPAFSTTLRVDGTSPGPGLPNIPGTVVNGEKDLGLPGRKPQGRIEIMFRLRERNRLRVDYFETDRSANRTLSRQVQFGNDLFDVGDEASTSLDYRMFGLTYTYSFVRTSHFEVGAGLAVHFVEADAQGAVVARQLRDEVSGAGAFPTIPLDATWLISKRFALTARGQYFHLANRTFAGELADFHSDLQYRWKPNFTVGAGYTWMKVFLELNQATFPGEYKLLIRGPEAFFKVSF